MKNPNKVLFLKQRLDTLESNLAEVKKLLTEIWDEEEIEKDPNFGVGLEEVGLASGKEHVIKGIFTGEGMFGQDGKKYPVPANYASKSKLLEGDNLKLTIDLEGAYLYKQIGPVEKRRVLGILEQERDKYYVRTQEGRYQVLLASVSYFKARPGDEVVLVLPKERSSTWGAIESLVSSLKNSEVIQVSNEEAEEEPIEEEKPVEEESGEKETAREMPKEETEENLADGEI